MFLQKVSCGHPQEVPLLAKRGDVFIKVMSNVRLARPDDAQAIHLILQETWGDSLLFDVFMDHISSPEHQVFVAVEVGEVVGFLSALLIPNPAPRWEIDLVVVCAASRGKGIGTSLIKEALIYGSHLGARWAKASIRVDNYASQRSFSKVGFTTNAQAGGVFVWDPLACKSATNASSLYARKSDLGHYVARNIRFLFLGSLTLYIGTHRNGILQKILGTLQNLYEI